MSDVAWTETRIETLKRLWADGLSAGQIAVELGGVTRNGVIGKVHRLGLSGRKKSTASRAPRVPRAPRAARIVVAATRKVRRVVNHDGKLSTVEALEPALPAGLPATDIPIEQRKTLIELTNETCRWPYGDPGMPDFFFCGAPEADFVARVPYCRYHTAFACGRIRAPAIVPGRVAA